jgi:cobalt-zinc-cadmium efflux system outer membrane protein
MTQPLALILLLAACSMATSAADPTSTNRLAALTLEQSLALAGQRHPDLAEARALIAAANGRTQQAGTFPNPEAIVRIEQAPFNGRAFGGADYLAGVAQPVPLGGRLAKARQVEQLELDRRARELEVRRREILKRVHGAFATALYQERAFLAQQEIAASADKLRASTRARLDAGDALREDLARAEMELSLARAELRRSDAMRERAMGTLIAAIGDPALSVKSLDGTLDAAFELPAMEALVAGLALHPAAALVDADIRASYARIDLAKAQRIPDVRVELLYRRVQAGKENAFDIGLNIPLPLFDRNQGRIREARAEATAAEARSRSTRNELTFRLREAHAELATALASSRSLKTDILPRADTVLKGVETRYSAGDISLNEVLPARRNWALVQLTYLESIRDVMQAWGTVSSLTGTN